MRGQQGWKGGYSTYKGHLKYVDAQGSEGAISEQPTPRKSNSVVGYSKATPYYGTRNHEMNFVLKVQDGIC